MREAGTCGFLNALNNDDHDLTMTRQDLHHPKQPARGGDECQVRKETPAPHVPPTFVSSTPPTKPKLHEMKR